MDQYEEKFFQETNEDKREADDSTNLHVEFTKAGSALGRPKIVASADSKNLESESEGQLTIDVYQTPDEIVVESAVAGVEPDDLDINVTTDSVTIRGHRRHNKEVKDEDYFYQECYWGRFSRAVILPQEVDAENSYATFKNGILAVHLPKLKREKSKKVKVKFE